jgi:hypothetical protein
MEVFKVYIYLNISMLVYGRQLHSVPLRQLNTPGQESLMFAGR